MIFLFKSTKIYWKEDYKKIIQILQTENSIQVRIIFKLIIFLILHNLRNQVQIYVHLLGKIACLWIRFLEVT